MVVIARLVSRVEAIVLVSALETAGIIARADGIHHASVEVISLGLGGHRIWVPASQHEEASAIIREIGVDRNWEFSHGLQRAVLRFLGIWFCVWAPFGFLGIFTGNLTALQVLVGLPLSALSIHVNPQGRGDYYLIASKS